MSPARTAASVIVLACFTTLAVLPAQAADDATLRKDLGAVITLLGQPCGEVVSVVRKTENDNIARCSNGVRYRIFVNAEGRVVAQKQ